MEKNEKELEIAATHYTDEHEHIYAEYHAFIAGANWQKQQSDKEYTLVVSLLKTQVMNSVGGSLSNKMDYWAEYCEEHNIAS